MGRGGKSTVSRTQKVVKPKIVKKSQNSKKIKEVENTVTLPVERKEPFALVLYGNGTTGVIQTSSLAKKDRFVSNKCNAPDPIDLKLTLNSEGSNDKPETFPATIIEFGSNIDWLYRYKVRTDGTVSDDLSCETPVAEKRTNYLLNQAKLRKESSMHDFDSSLRHLSPIGRNSSSFGEEYLAPEKISLEAGPLSTANVSDNFALFPKHDSGPAVTFGLNIPVLVSPSSADLSPLLPLFNSDAGLRDMDSAEEQIIHQSELPTDSNKVGPETNTERLSTDDESYDSTVNPSASSDNIQMSWSSDDDIGITSPKTNIVLPKGPSVDSVDQTNYGIMAQAAKENDSSSSEKSQDTKTTDASRELTVDTSLPIRLSPMAELVSKATPENIQFIQMLSNPSNILFLKEFCEAFLLKASENQHDKVLTEINQSINPEQERGEEQESVLDFNQMECSKTGPEKYLLVSNHKIYIGRADFMNLPPPHHTTANIPEGTDTVAPRSLVADLLDLLVPKEIQPKHTAKTIPKEIRKAIFAYVNVRLPPDHKIKKEKITTYITDKCRGILRDRVGEASRRALKIANGEPPKKRTKKST